MLLSFCDLAGLYIDRERETEGKDAHLIVNEHETALIAAKRFICNSSHVHQSYHIRQLVVDGSQNSGHVVSYFYSFREIDVHPERN